MNLPRATQPPTARWRLAVVFAALTLAASCEAAARGPTIVNETGHDIWIAVEPNDASTKPLWFDVPAGESVPIPGTRCSNAGTMLVADAPKLAAVIASRDLLADPWCVGDPWHWRGPSSGR